MCVPVCLCLFTGIWFACLQNPLTRVNLCLPVPRLCPEGAGVMTTRFSTLFINQGKLIVPNTPYDNTDGVVWIIVRLIFYDHSLAFIFR